MKFFFAPLLCLTLAHAQEAESPEIQKARAGVARIEELVAQGALAKARLVDAQDNLADAEDEATLRQTLYGTLSVEDLAGDEAAKMLRAAERRVVRTEARLASFQKLVDDGIAARVQLEPLEIELGGRKNVLDLARMRARLADELLEMARTEEEHIDEYAPSPVWKAMERYDGNGLFKLAQMKAIESAYFMKFSKSLPVSAYGMTAVHRTLGFDHTGRVDVALAPDSAEGVWLRRFLETNRIPYFAFRSFIPNAATAPHIHIGPPSARIRVAD